MDVFAQRKLLIRIVIILVFLNVFSIGIFLWKDFSHKPPPRENREEQRDVSDVLKNQLNLSEKQVQQFKDIRSGFFDKEKALSKVIRAERDSMNEAMFNKNTSEDLIKSLAKAVADNEYQMELLRYEQSKQLKAICTPEQMEKFGELVKEIRDYFRPDNKPERKRKD